LKWNPATGNQIYGRNVFAGATDKSKVWGANNQSKNKKIEFAIANSIGGNKIYIIAYNIYFLI